MRVYVSKYPFDELKINKYFIVNGYSKYRKLKKPFNLSMYHQSLRNMSCKWGKILNKKFTVNIRSGDIKVKIKRIK